MQLRTRARQQTLLEDELREKRHELRVLSHRLLETQEAERRRIASELHDDLGQCLTAIRLTLQTPEPASRRIADSLALVDQAVEQVRNLARDLRPSILDHLGLVAALRWLLGGQSRRSGYEGRLVSSGSDTRPPSAIETCCFRLAQEGLTNVGRHADAKHVTVDVHVSDELVRLVLRDDGKGFDVKAARDRAARGGSVGMLSMEERVSLVGGNLRVQSTPGAGTTLVALFAFGKGETNL